METAMNQLLVEHFNDPRIREIILKMDVGHDRRGKLGFIKALDLLPSGALSFVKLLGDLRSTVVHDIKWLKLDLKKHLQHKDRKGGWKNALNWWRRDRNAESDEAVFLYPRQAIVDAASIVMSAAAVRKVQARAGHRKIEAALALQDFREAQLKLRRMQRQAKTKESPKHRQSKARPA
jgi:hypothetical protein